MTFAERFEHAARPPSYVEEVERCEMCGDLIPKAPGRKLCFTHEQLFVEAVRKVLERSMGGQIT